MRSELQGTGRENSCGRFQGTTTPAIILREWQTSVRIAGTLTEIRIQVSSSLNEYWNRERDPTPTMNTRMWCALTSTGSARSISLSREGNKSNGCSEMLENVFPQLQGRAIIIFQQDGAPQHVWMSTQGQFLCSPLTRYQLIKFPCGEWGVGGGGMRTTQQWSRYHSR